MAIVQGNDVILKFNPAGGGTGDGVSLVPFGCARSITVNRTTDTIGKSTIGSGNWKEYEAVAKGWDFTLEGIVYLNEMDKLTSPSVYEMWDSMQPIQVEYFETDEAGNEVAYSGEALITGVSTNGAVNNVASINITGQGTGELLTLTSLLRIINVQVDIPAAGQTTLTFDFDPVEGATAYTIEINDLTTGTIINDTAGEAPRDEVIDSSHNYAFRLRYEVGGSFGLPVYYPSPQLNDNYVIDSDSVEITDSDNLNLLTS